MLVQAVGDASGQADGGSVEQGLIDGLAAATFGRVHGSKEKVEGLLHDLSGGAIRRRLGYGQGHGQGHLLGVASESHGPGDALAGRLDQIGRPLFGQGVAQPRAESRGRHFGLLEPGQGAHGCLKNLVREFDAQGGLGDLLDRLSRQPLGQSPVGESGYIGDALQRFRTQLLIVSLPLVIEDAGADDAAHDLGLVRGQGG